TYCATRGPRKCLSKSTFASRRTSARETPSYVIFAPLRPLTVTFRRGNFFHAVLVIVVSLPASMLTVRPPAFFLAAFCPRASARAGPRTRRAAVPTIRRLPTAWALRRNTIGSPQLFAEPEHTQRNTEQGHDPEHGRVRPQFGPAGPAENHAASPIDQPGRG